MDIDNEGGGQVDQNTARQVVNDNMDLGLSADDLGMDRDDPFEGLDLGDGNDDLEVSSDLDDLSLEAPQPQTQQNQQQQQPAPGQQPQPQGGKPLPQYALVKPDGKGNLVDGNGQIVARAGAEARNYQKFARHFEAPLRAAATQIAATNQRAQQVESNLQQAIQIGEQLTERVRQLATEASNNNVAQTFGLSQDELVRAATFAKQAKADPASAIKSILTMAAAHGIDMKSVLGPNAQGAGFDPKSLLELIKGEISQAVKPLNDRTAQEQQQQQQQQAFQAEVGRIQTEARTFFSRTPDAVPFLEAFRAIKTDPNLRGLSMEHVWSEIQLKLAKSGHTPASYIQAVRAKQQNPNGGTMPTGRARAQPVAPAAPASQQNEHMAPVSTSYEDIVRDLLRST
jgi:hypothetical protein